MWKNDKPEDFTKNGELSTVETDKKKAFDLLKRKENDIPIMLNFKKVREHDGLFKHRVTGKEFNTFVIDTQNAIIQMKQDMLSFAGKVDGMGDDLDKVDKRHNKVNEATVQALKKAVEDMQQREKKYANTLRMYQIITVIAVATAIISFVICFF